MEIYLLLGEKSAGLKDIDNFWRLCYNLSIQKKNIYVTKER